jgi:hypothetical protein
MKKERKSKKSNIKGLWITDGFVTVSEDWKAEGAIRYGYSETEEQHKRQIK